MNRISCKGCKYNLPLSESSPHFKICHYMLLTGEMRGCSPEKCERKEYDEKNQNKIPPRAGDRPNKPGRAGV